MKKQHEHRWHPFRGSSWSVVHAGQMVQKCDYCDAERAIPVDQTRKTPPDWELIETSPTAGTDDPSGPKN